MGGRNYMTSPPDSTCPLTAGENKSGSSGTAKKFSGPQGVPILRTSSYCTSASLS